MEREHTEEEMIKIENIKGKLILNGAIGLVGYYGFTTIEGAKIRSVK